MRHTPFAGLTQLDPSDPITLDGASFQERNPAITDRLLRVGALSHRHDAHAALPSPTEPLSASLLSDGGALSAETDYSLTYTLSDADGGETRAAPIVTLTTGAQLAAPDSELGALVDYSAGIMPAGSYFYAKTLVDGAGGETGIGPATLAYVDPGYASAQVQLSGLADGVPAGGAWRLWRSAEGEDWHLVTQATDDTYLDTGFDPPDNPAVPPTDNETGATWSISVTLPTVASATAINLYLGSAGDFTSPSLYDSYPTASGGAAITITSDVVQAGAPPAVSTAIGGAAKIDPDTDMLDFPWKRTVATAADLPASDNEDGDTRIVRADHVPRVWDADAGLWNALASGGGGGGGGSGGVSVKSAGYSIPGTGVAWDEVTELWNDLGCTIDGWIVVPPGGLYIVSAVCQPGGRLDPDGEFPAFASGTQNFIELTQDIQTITEGRYGHGHDRASLSYDAGMTQWFGIGGFGDGGGPVLTATAIVGPAADGVGVLMPMLMFASIDPATGATTPTCLHNEPLTITITAF